MKPNVPHVHVYKFQSCWHRRRRLNIIRNLLHTYPLLVCFKENQAVILHTFLFCSVQSETLAAAFTDECTSKKANGMWINFNDEFLFAMGKLQSVPYI